MGVRIQLQYQLEQHIRDELYEFVCRVVANVVICERHSGKHLRIQRK